MTTELGTSIGTFLSDVYSMLLLTKYTCSAALRFLGGMLPADTSWKAQEVKFSFMCIFFSFGVCENNHLWLVSVDFQWINCIKICQ